MSQWPPLKHRTTYGLIGTIKTKRGRGGGDWGNGIRLLACTFGFTLRLRYSPPMLHIMTHGDDMRMLTLGTIYVN